MKQILLLVAIFFSVNVFAQSEWHIVPGKLTTEWAQTVSPQNVLPEYPRPQLVRNDWTNLNGLWKYTIVPAAIKENTPASYDGNILVPFAVESALSGVGRTVGKDSVLWYQRQLSLKADPAKIYLLQFGAVDWQCDVFVNGKAAGTHKGGYDPFTLDITPYLSKSGTQDLMVRVWDPSDDGPQPRGKQIKNPRGIWYTPVTGIWQTVWLEAVPATYISSLKPTAAIDRNELTVEVNTEHRMPGDVIEVTAFDHGKPVAQQRAGADGKAVLKIASPKLWSPDQPNLYDLKVSVRRNGKTIDEVSSYAAMRKISVAADKDGIQRILLNNEFVFQYGPLDQGWWPDGLYTAPNDAALKSDIVTTKEMGFNMIRKHVKVEPARWYAYCDQLGMLVWQDMPSGDMGNQWEPRPGVYGRATEKERTPESEAIYRTEWAEIMKDLYPFPSIVIWTPFNEAWGQFKTVDIVNWTMKQDPSRLVNTASGGNFVTVGPIMDLHNYPEPLMPDPVLFGKGRALVLGEFGGLGLPVEGHTWQSKNNWGYQSFKNGDELYARYAQLVSKLPELIRKGLSAAVYTQTTDV
jgi:beta-galactosidase/beta-glucuronidase